MGQRIKSNSLMLRLVFNELKTFKAKQRVMNDKFCKVTEMAEARIRKNYFKGMIRACMIR